MASTLFDKVWDSHVVRKIDDGPDILFIDRHFIHEVTSPVAFLSLEQRGLNVLYPDRTFATADHNTPTTVSYTHLDVYKRQDNHLMGCVSLATYCYLPTFGSVT